jgi:hypothetical protein
VEWRCRPWCGQLKNISMRDAQSAAGQLDLSLSSIDPQTLKLGKLTAPDSRMFALRITPYIGAFWTVPRRIRRLSECLAEV